MKGVAAVLISLGVVDLVLIDTVLGPTVLGSREDQEPPVVVRAHERESVPPKAAEAKAAEVKAEEANAEEANAEEAESPAVPETVSSSHKATPTSSVLFETASTRLEEASTIALALVIDELEAQPQLMVTLTGHADDRGPKATNYRLGLRRARSVRRHLMRNGVRGSRVTIRSEGETHPRMLGDGDVARRRNRRVDIKLSTKESK